MKKALFILISFLLLVQSVFSASAPTEKERKNFGETLFTGNAEYVENFLRSYPAYAKEKPALILFAAGMGHTEVVSALIKNGANVNAKDDNNNGRTALMYAAGLGHTEVVSVLLKNGANVNEKTNDGETALMYAALDGHTETASILLKNKADVNAQNNEGWTALMISAQNGHTDIVSVLLKNKADINAKKQ